MTESGIFEGLSTSKLAVELNDEERRTLGRWIAQGARTE